MRNTGTEVTKPRWGPGLRAKAAAGPQVVVSLRAEWPCLAEGRTASKGTRFSRPLCSPEFFCSESAWSLGAAGPPERRSPSTDMLFRVPLEYLTCMYQEDFEPGVRKQTTFHSQSGSAEAVHLEGLCSPHSCALCSGPPLPA